ncbi:MAG: peptidylprolyl isomerase [Lacipirellulaceae bacterium]
MPRAFQRRLCRVCAALGVALLGVLGSAQPLAPPRGAQSGFARGVLAEATGVPDAKTPQPMNECEVLARVNGEVIVARDILWEAELMLRQRLAKIPEEQRAAAPPQVLVAAKRQLVQQLVFSRLDMALFYADFRAKSPQANLEKIHESLSVEFDKRELPKLREQLGAKDEAEVNEKLFALGTTLEERRQDFYNKMIARSWLTETVKYNKEVTHEEMLAYYHTNHSKYEFPARAKWEELVARFDRYASQAEAYRAIALMGNAAHQVAAALPAEAPAFGEVAKRSSQGFNAPQGGLYDWTTKGALAAEEVDRLLFELPIGQMSPIVTGPTGFHLVRVVAREEAGVKEFRAVQAKIGETIKNERFNDAVQKRVSRLKDGAMVWTAFTGDVNTARTAAADKPASPY